MCWYVVIGIGVVVFGNFDEFGVCWVVGVVFYDVFECLDVLFVVV